MKHEGGVGGKKKATVLTQTVREAVRQMVAEAHDPEDHVVFIDSSHGNGDGKGNSYTC